MQIADVIVHKYSAKPTSLSLDFFPQYTSLDLNTR